MLLDIDKFCKETIIDGSYLPEITSSSTRLSNGTYDSKGLFSIDIFGQERSTRWKTMYAKITIPHPVIHPAIFYIINRRVSYLLKWINLDFGFVIDKNTNHFVLTNTVNNYDYCGITDLYSNANIVVDTLSKTGKFDTLSAKTIMARLIDRKLPIFTSNVIVMPPIFRPNDEDNTFYIKIIEEINILRSALSSKDKILTNRILANIQNIYNYLFESMVDKIKGKTGLIRGSMLGKNADFSGRAVIVVDPDIKPSQLGVPRTMLIRLFYPWIINYIIHNDRVKKELNDLKVATNIPSLFNLINNDLFEKSIDNRIYKILNMVMEIVIKDKVILSKRDPVLHKLSVRGFYPVPVDDTSIHITPLVTTGFNADFDGDQMSVFVPLTDKAQKIVKEKMLATKNLWHPVKGLSYTIEKDFVLGIYTMTKDDATADSKVTTLSNSDNIIQRLIESDHMYNLVNYKGRTNTIGRRVVEILFNDTIQVKEAVDEKKLSSYLEKVAKEDPDSLEDVMYHVIQVSKVISSIFGGTMSVKDFIMPKDLIDKKNEVLKNPDKYDVDSELTNITKEFMVRNTSASTNQLPTLLVNSGARGSAGNIKQISVAKGYVSDTSGKVLPDAIGSNFVEGFKPIDYFISAYGSRKGVVDRVLNTAKSGYLQRQMMYLVASVKSSDTKDCGTNKFLDVVLTEEYANVLANRVLDNGAILTNDYIKQHDLIGKMIHVYTPMYCRSKGLCRKCFPEAYRKAIDNVTNVGMVSGNIVGERASQLQMKTFHLGGAASMLYLSKEAPQLNGIIGQDGMQLIANKDIRIKVIDYTNDSTEEFASVDFDVITKDDGNEVSVHFPAVIKFNSLIARNMKIEDTDVYLEYDSGEIIGEILATATDVASAVLVLQSIMNHADQFESGKDIVTELYETFRIATKIPLIYLEIIVSQLMRDPKKIYYPYRLGSMTEAPKFVGIKSVASLESPTRGIMFERLLDTITNSVLIGDTKDERLKSDLEELFAI